MRRGEKPEVKARNQEVYCLNIKSNKIFRNKTQNLFYEKKAGIAEITKETALKFCKRTAPERYENLEKYYEENPSDMFIDFENHFEGIENMYKQVLLKVVVNQKIENLFDKTHIALFIYSQTIRNHIFWAELIDVFKSNDLEKFEMFIDLKNSLSNTNKLMISILPFIRSKWSLYITKNPKFPLSDNPVLIRPLHIYLPLAPDLLLELDMRKQISEHENCSHYQKMPLKSYIDFENQTIENSSREIIFCKEGLLEKWQNSVAYKTHIEKIKRLPTQAKKH